jgi:ribonuclease HI
MTSRSPQNVLFAEASRNSLTAQTWRFVLQNLDNHRRFSASDIEECTSYERLELLAVVRGLEALEGPVRVTLVTKSRYVSRGLKLGLDEWRANNWRWERFGELVTVRDHDLWQRVDHALQYHEVECQTWHFEESPQNCSIEYPELLAESPSAEPTIFTEPFLRERPVRPKKRRPTVFRANLWADSRNSLRRPVGASA